MDEFALTGVRHGFSGKRRHSALAAVAVLCLLAVFASRAAASGPPLIGAGWSSAVGSDSAKLSAFINPNGSNTTYHFEYTTEANYQAHGFTGALRSPTSGETTLGLSALTVTKSISSLTAATAYRYRAVAQNADPAGSQFGPTRTFTTQAPAASSSADTCSNKPVRDQQFVTFLADCRAFEMVSPVDKNGGQVDPPETIADGGVLQAAAARRHGHLRLHRLLRLGSGSSRGQPVHRHPRQRFLGDPERHRADLLPQRGRGRRPTNSSLPTSPTP